MDLSNGLINMKQCRRFLLWPLALVWASGCGVGEYESDFKDAAQRINYADEENKFLGQLAEAPKLPPAKKKPVDWSLRLPKQIKVQAEPEPVGSFLYRYVREPERPQQFNPDAPPRPNNGIVEVYVGVTSLSEKRKEDFQR